MTSETALNMMAVTVITLQTREWDTNLAPTRSRARVDAGIAKLEGLVEKEIFSRASCEFAMALGVCCQDL
jgi:hypothetical protein